MNNKILMIVNVFPPSGESGTQRPVKFLKYLALDGWETFVITPKKPVNNLITDETLVTEIPSITKVFRTSSWALNDEKLPEIRSEFTSSKKTAKKIIWAILKLINDVAFPIDKQIGWVPFALIKAIHIINRHKVRNIYITAYPFSAFVCGVVLKKIYGEKIHWLADYRDAWQFAPLIKKQVLPFRYKIICKIEEYFLRSADCVVFPTSYIKDRYQEKYSWVKGKSTLITNGYDEDDFTNVTPKIFNKFTFVYMGKIHVTKGDPIPLLKVIDKLVKIEFQYLHVGTIGKQMLKKIEDRKLNFYQYLGYKEHKEAISYSAGADVNVIIINNDIESVGVYSGKLFELIRIGKPILAVGPQQSVIRDLFNEINAGIYAYIDDEKEIEKALCSIISGSFVVNVEKKDIEQYSRKSCTSQLEKMYS